MFSATIIVNLSTAGGPRCPMFFTRSPSVFSHLHDVSYTNPTFVPSVVRAEKYWTLTETACCGCGEHVGWLRTEADLICSLAISLPFGRPSDRLARYCDPSRRNKILY